MASFHRENTSYQSMRETSRPVRSPYRVDELGRGGQHRTVEGRRGGDAERHRALGTGVEDHRPGEVDQGVADRRHLPVDDRQQLGRRRLGEQHVVELVVAVRERRCLVGRERVGQPVPDPGRGRQRSTTVRVELRQPAPDLAFEVGPSVREFTETARVPVDRVDVCECVDELVQRTRLLRRLRRPRLRDAAAHRDTVDAGHHVERRAEHLGVVAREHRTRDADRLVLDRVEEPELAQHVVRGGGAAVRWRLTQDPARVTRVSA